MAEDRLLSKLMAGQVAVGIGVRRGPWIVGQIAKAGFDWFLNDHMHGGLDWSEAESMVYAARAAGLTPMMRVNSMPWASTDTDRHVAAEVARAVSLGYTAITWSYSSVEEVRQCAKMAYDWHRNVAPSSGDEMLEVEGESKESVLIIPLVESLEAINTMEEVMSVDGIRALWVAITDTSRVLGHPFDVEHPDVWRVVDKAVNIAKKKGIWMGCNTSYIFHDIESVIQRVKRLHDHGIDFVYAQGIGYVFDYVGQALTDGIRAELGYSK